MIVAAPLVGKHVGRFTAVIRKRTVIAAPVAFPRHEEDQFTARAGTAHAAFRFALFCRENLGRHWQQGRHSTQTCPTSDVVSNRRCLAWMIINHQHGEKPAVEAPVKWSAQGER